MCQLKTGKVEYIGKNGKYLSFQKLTNLNSKNINYKVYMYWHFYFAKNFKKRKLISSNI